MSDDSAGDASRFVPSYDEGLRLAVPGVYTENGFVGEMEIQLALIVARIYEYSFDDLYDRAVDACYKALVVHADHKPVHEVFSLEDVAKAMPGDLLRQVVNREETALDGFSQGVAARHLPPGDRNCYLHLMETWLTNDMLPDQPTRHDYESIAFDGDLRNVGLGGQTIVEILLEKNALKHDVDKVVDLLYTHEVLDSTTLRVYGRVNIPTAAGIVLFAYQTFAEGVADVEDMTEAAKDTAAKNGLLALMTSQGVKHPNQ